MDDLEVDGVRLSDLYEDADGLLWRVVSIATEPTVTVEPVENVESPCHREHFVIRSPRWRDRWARRYRAEEIPGG